MEGARAAAALLVLAAYLASSAAAPVNEQTGLDIYDAGAKDGCYYNFQHYGEGDRIMTNEPCLNCTCHNRMLMCYLRVCPFTKPVGQDCTIEKRGDQCCPVITCPDVHVDLLTSTSTTSPAEYGSSEVGHLEKYGCSFGGKFFSEGSKMPSTPNKPCELCYCIRNMTACVMQECTLHVDGCTPVYHKDVCCPVRYSCDHPQDEIPMLDDLSTTVRPTTGFLLTTTVPPGVTQDCVHQDEVFADGALIKTEKACEHCYCMKGDIVCVVQECGTPMENEGKNCTSMQPREGQCCPDTYICEGDTIIEDTTNELLTTYLPTQAPTRRSEVEGSGEESPTQNVPFATTQSPLTEEEKEGSGFESGEIFPDGSIAETTDSSLSEPSMTSHTLNTNIPDLTTEPTKTAEDVVKLPKKEVTPTTEKSLDKESSPTLNEEAIQSIPSTSMVPDTTEPSVQDTTDRAGEEVTLKTTDDKADFEKEIGQSSTPKAINDIESTEKLTDKTTKSQDEHTTEIYLEKQTAITASEVIDQSTEKLNESTDFKYEQSTEKYFGPTTVQEIDKLTSEFSTNQPIDTTNLLSTDTIPEDRKKVNDILTTEVDERSTEKLHEQVTEKLSKKPGENIDEQTTEETAAVNEKSTQNVPEMSTVSVIAETSETIAHEPTEKATKETSVSLNEQSTENIIDDTTQNIVEQATEKLFEVTNHVLDEHTTENLPEKTSETLISDTSDEFREQTTVEVPKATGTNMFELSTEKVQETTETVFEHSTEKTYEDKTNALDEHSTVMLVDETSEVNKERPAENIPDYTIPSEHTTEKLEEISDRLNEQSTIKSVEQTSENIYELSTVIESTSEKLDDNTNKEASEHPDEQSSDKIADEITEKVDTHTDKGTEDTTEYTYEKPTTNIVQQSTEKLDKPSTEKSAGDTRTTLSEQTTEIFIPQTNENIDKQSTQTASQETTNIFEESTKTMDGKSTEIYNAPSTEVLGVQSTHTPDESFTESYYQPSTGKIEELLTEKVHEVFTEKAAELSNNELYSQSTEILDEQKTTTPVSLSEESSISSSEVSGEPISVESTEKLDDKYGTSSVKPLDEHTISEPVSTSEQTDQRDTSESIPTEYTPTEIVDSYTTSKVITEKTESQTDNIPEKQDNDSTTIPSRVEDSEQTKVTSSESYTAAPETTENIISIEPEEPQTDDNATIMPHGITDDKIESSPESNKQIEKESTPKQESLDNQSTTVLEPITQTQSTLIEIVTTENIFETTTQLPAAVTETTVKADLSHISSETTIVASSTESLPEISVEPMIPAEEATEVDKEIDTQHKGEEGTIKPDQGSFTLQSEYSTVSPEKIVTTTAIGILSSSTSELTDKESVQPTIITEATPVTTVPDESENEIHEDEQTIGHILPHIPGEGDCLVDGKTYTNDSIIPSTNKCQSSCKCVSSIVKCDQIQCSPPPENMINCQPMYDAKESCCPTYVCDHAKETVAPESHNQMLDVTTELPSVQEDGHTSIKPAVSETPQKPQCDSGECQATEETIVPVAIPECSSGICDSTSEQFPVPHRSSDENVPSDQNHSQTPDCSSGTCSQEPPISPNQENGNIPVIPVVIGVPEDCNGDVCTPTIKDSSGETHVPHDTAVPELPVSICSGEDCQLGSEDCKGEDCEKPVNPSCTGDRCDLPKSPDALPTDECKSGDCKELSSTRPELHVPVNTQCTGDGCIGLPVSIHENEEPTKASPVSSQSGDVPCEGNCDTSLPVVTDTSLIETCKDGQCGLDGETTTAPVESVCTGDVCDSSVTSTDSSEDQCNSGVCQKPISESPESTGSPSCTGDICETPQITELQTIIPEACINGDCRRTDNITPPSQPPINIPCIGDQCDVQSAAPETSNVCKTDDCKPQISDIIPPSHRPLDIPCNGDQCDVQHTADHGTNDECNTDDCKPQISEIPVKISCTGDLCNLPPAISEETTLSSDCKEGDCKEKAETQKTKDTTCTGTECQVVETTQGTRAENEATSTIIPSEEAKSTQENVEFTTKLSIEITTPTSKDNESEKRVSSSLPNLNDMPTEPPRTLENETTQQSSIANSGSAQTESSYSTEELFTTPSDTKLNEIPTDFMDNKMTTVNLPETNSTQSDLTEHSESDLYLHDVTTLHTIVQSTELHASEDEVGPTDKYKTDEIDEQTEGKDISVMTENANIDETTKSIPEEPSIDATSTEYIKSEQTTPQPEIQQFTVTESEITEGIQHQTRKPVKDEQKITTDESSPPKETTTAYSVELEQHTHAPDDEYKPIEQVTVITPEQLFTTKVEEPELTTASIIREKDQPDVQSHTIDDNVPQSNIEPEIVNIQTTTSPDITATEKIVLVTKRTDDESTTSEITNLPEVSSEKTRVPTEMSTDGTTLPNAEKDVVEFVTKKETSDSIGNTETTSSPITVTESVAPSDRTDIPKDVIATDAVTHIPENEPKPVTGVSEPMESPTTALATGGVQSPELVTTIKPDMLDEPVEGNTESSTIGSEKDITGTQDITESSNVADKKTTIHDYVTETPETRLETTSLGSADQHSTKKPTELIAANYPDLSTTKMDDDVIVTVLPIHTSTSYTQNTNAPMLEGGNVPTETPEVLQENDRDRITTIVNEPNDHTTQLPIDVSNTLSSDVTDKTQTPEDIEKYTTPVPESIITDMPVESEISVTDNAMQSATDIAEELTEQPETSNEIPKGETSEEDQQVTGSKIDELPEPVTYIPNVTSKPEGESLESHTPTSTEVYSIEPSSPAPEPSNGLPFEEEGPGQRITSMEQATTENLATLNDNDPSTSQSPLTTESQEISNKQSTISTDLETVKFEMTSLLEPIIAVTNENTTPVAQRVQPDATTEHSDRISTTQGFDTTKMSSEQTTELSELPNLTTIAAQIPTTIESISTHSESEQEPIKLDTFDNKPTTSSTETTPEEVASVTAEQTNIPTTPKVDSTQEPILSIEDTRTTVQPLNVTDMQSNLDLETEKPDSDDKIQTTTDDEKKPVISDDHPGVPSSTGELPSPSDDADHQSPDRSPSPGYGGAAEQDYEEEDQAFGPGTCRYGGKVYVSAQQIPRDDPCDFCFCFRSDIICLQQSCPPPIHGCHEEPISGFCCPRYECPVSMATTLNVTTTTTTTTTTLPPHFPSHAYKGAAQRRGCHIKGHSYQVGEVVRASSGPCLHCTCGGDGQMKCDPKVCTPEPMLRQMIAAAVSTKRRR